MFPGLFNNRLTLSTGISLLLHLFVLFSLNLLLQLPTKKTVTTPVEVLEVRFAPQLQPRAQSKLDKHLLTRESNEQFKVTQVEIKKAPDTIPTPPAPVVEPTPPATAGIALPGAITLPWQLPGRSSSSLFHPPPSQQNTAQNYYQQALEAQARQRTEYQAQLILQQLQQLLAKELDVIPAVSGSCKLNAPGENTHPRLTCDSPALYEVIAKNEMNVVGMLVALRSMGEMINGFSAELHSDKLNIFLLNESSQTGQSSGTSPANKTH